MSVTSQRVNNGRSGPVWWAIAAGLAVILTVVLVPSAPAETEEVSGCYCVGTVGNVNCDYRDEITLADIAFLIDHLFISERRLPNLDEANIDGDPAGLIEMADVAMLIDHLFISGIELPLCPQPYNSPPETHMVGQSYWQLFINAVEPGSAVTGVRVTWEGEDRVDHPYDSPDFRFEYRMYGPYSDSLYNLIIDSFEIRVFRTNDGQILRYDQDPLETFVVCDTSWLPGGVPEILCDTVLVDTIDGANIYGRVDTLLDVESPEFVFNPDLNRTCAVSGDGGDVWTQDTSDSLYNLFAYYPSDTTMEANFIFWVRAQDPLDPDVYDPTPAFTSLSVIDPKFERDVLVMNWTASAHENKAQEDSAAAYWCRSVNAWTINAGLDGIVQYDPERDFQWVAYYEQNSDLLRLALKYKVLVEIQDAVVSGAWSHQNMAARDVMTALTAGANVWIAVRVPLGYQSLGSLPYTEWSSSDYQYFFGVQRYLFPGWGCHLLDYFDGYGYGLPRVEDFIGATSENPSGWPDISIDTARLHHCYWWDGSLEPLAFPFYPFRSDLGALPQVGWIEPTENAEIMYRYRSLYGEEEHPYVPRDFHNKPVMVRVDRGSFRTVHSVFTPLALEEATGQQMVNSVLSWLYAKWLPDRASPPFPPSESAKPSAVGRTK